MLAVEGLDRGLGVLVAALDEAPQVFPVRADVQEALTLTHDGLGQVVRPVTQRSSCSGEREIDHEQKSKQNLSANHTKNK